MKLKYLWAAVYSLLLTAFTIYAALDTFVTEQVYESVPLAGETSASDGVQTETASAECETFPIAEKEVPTEQEVTSEQEVSSENVYQNENVRIVLTQYREYDSDIYVADVTLSSPEYLKTAFAKSAYGKNVKDKTSEIAADVGAVLAINGDYYGAREKGFVIRNGVLYRDTASADTEILVIGGDGSFEIMSETDTSAQALLDDGAVQVLSFGPGLIADGEIIVTEKDEVGKAMASNPRTAIGMIDELHYLLVVSDGRTSESEGLSLYELAEFMQSIGAETAYNLDGGGSSTMVFQGEIINHPTTNGKKIKEREVSDIVYIAAE